MNLENKNIKSFIFFNRKFVLLSVENVSFTLLLLLIINVLVTCIFYSKVNYI